ncbi:MAG: hypothetical protein DRJ29_07435 [Bacteroidetes bacterium]|nr:MAG: hypothetical protein DRJ29_07435 [Bacteroidota bacterium]RLE06299.1 MAG: hypothetical protein DRJ13_00540 [Bacteroidota bacterium]
MASLTEITGVLGRNRAAHLLRRATFGPTIPEIDQFAALTATQAMALLLDDAAENPLPPIDLLTGSTWVDPTGVSGPPFAGSGNSEQDQLFEYFQAWHMDVMRKAPLTLKERITWFLHTHLPARWTEINQSESIYYQNCLYRHYAYGSFKELFKKICVDNAMLRYLDGYSNKKNSPNENFAREMFELYSIGRGEQVVEGDYTNYTEEDIKAATRVLTGWNLNETFSFIDPDTGLPAGKMDSQMAGDGTTELATEHDTEPKTFSSKFGGTVIQTSSIVEDFATVEAAYGELDEMIEMIFSQQETGRFIARKLYRFFVYHFITEDAETDIIGPLAQTLIDNDFSIQELLTVLLKSEHFYDADDAVTENDNVGALIKSPVDIFTGLSRMFEIQYQDRETSTDPFYGDMAYVVSKLVDQGLNFYEPFEVAGYPAYHQMPGYNRNWITTYALAFRYQMGGILMKTLDQATERTFVLDIVDWVENSGHITDPSDAVEIMDVLVNNLYAIELTQERYDYFLYTVFLDYPEDQAYARGLWTQEWNAYQSSSDDTVVRSLLERLFSALIETPEFQIY